MEDVVNTQSQAEAGLALAYAPPETGRLIQQAVSRTEIPLAKVWQWIVGHRSQFLDITAEYAGGKQQKAIDDLLRLLRTREG